jgi:hypothetical protein
MGRESTVTQIRRQTTSERIMPVTKVSMNPRVRVRGALNRGTNM